MRAIGRNAPCPCGSGRKYKSCCLGRTRLAETGFTWLKLRATENAVMTELMDFVDRQYGPALLEAGWQAFTLQADPPLEAKEELETETIFLPWLLFNWVPAGKESAGLRYALRKPVGSCPVEWCKSRFPAGSSRLAQIAAILAGSST